jgi:multiple sugar transport system permease protein
MEVSVAETRSTPRALPVRWRRTIEGWMFIGPVILGIVAFQLVPILVSIYASLTRWDGMNPPAFTGLANYRELVVEDRFFRETLGNTIYFTAGHIPLTILLAMALALLCNLNLPGIALFRTAYFIPAVSNVVAVSVVWFWIYQPQYGVLNSLLAQVGIAGPAWLSDSTWAMPAVIVVSVWQGVGYPMVILLAGLQGVPHDLYEAARIDGAS